MVTVAAEFTHNLSTKTVGVHDICRAKVARLALVKPCAILVCLHISVGVALVRKAHDSNKRGFTVASTDSNRNRSLFGAKKHDAIGALVDFAAHTLLFAAGVVEFILAMNTGTHGSL